MDVRFNRMEQLIEVLAEARALVACYAIDHPALTASIEAAMTEAQALKQRAV
jgi:hypothetical protein